MSQVHQDGQGLEHLLCEEMLRKLGWFSLQKKGVWRFLIAACLHLQGGYQENEAKLFMLEHGQTTDANAERIKTGHEEKQDRLHEEQSGGGTGCPERLYSLHPQGFSGPYRIDPLAAWSEFRTDSALGRRLDK